MFLPDRYADFGGGALVLYASAFTLCALCVLYGVSLRHPLHHIPGPFWARWTPFWLAYHAYHGRRYTAVHDAHQASFFFCEKRYGSLVRISPNHISIASPDALSVVYGQGPKAPGKSPFYDAFLSNGKASIFSTRDRQDHSVKRRAVSHAFSSSALQEFIPFIHSTIEQFTHKMDELCDKAESFDALLWFNYLAFDILSDLVFGERIGMLENGSDEVAIPQRDNSTVTENAIALVDEREHFAAIVGIHPFLQWATNCMPFLSGHKAASGLEQLARRQVLKRLSSGTSRNDMLGKLIQARGYDSRSPTADEIAELTAESVTLLIAGSDTTSNSIAVILHYIFTNPRVHEKLLGLLLDAAGGQNELTYEQVKDIPYLQATINEGLRLHSTTAIGLHRSAPQGGLTWREQWFPEGTELSVPAWTIGHDPDLWGDAETFRPERWIEDKELRSYLLTFGKGPRACVSGLLAYMEMNSVISMMILKYNIEVASQELKTTEGFMHKPVDFRIRLSFRC
ncbi:benzoate para-hydroxylase [Mycena latifolia]|nr:benzoate para-hydroxylase [Mycena latifolia]